MLYVLILYCTGLCGELMPPPSDVLFFTSYADCRQKLAALPFTMIGSDGKLSPTQFKQTCARVFADPEQLDRLLDPRKLQKMLDDYKAHGDGWKPWQPSAEVMKKYGCTNKGLLLTCSSKRKR